jgi:hypothetical protein
VRIDEARYLIDEVYRRRIQELSMFFDLKKLPEPGPEIYGYPIVWDENPRPKIIGFNTPYGPRRPFSDFYRPSKKQEDFFNQDSFFYKALSKKEVSKVPYSDRETEGPTKAGEDRMFRQSLSSAVESQLRIGEQTVNRFQQVKRLKILLEKHKEVAEILELMRELGI